MECWTQGNRSGVLLLCSGVGYEVHLTERHQQNLSADSDLNLWIHQVQREDGSSLYGFPLRQERDLFRLLISVSGVGPQAGLALVQECRPQELVEAISSGDLRRLCKAQGIGKRTAERLAVELRASIAAFAGVDPAPPWLKESAQSRCQRAGPTSKQPWQCWVTTISKSVAPSVRSPRVQMAPRLPEATRTLGCGSASNG